MSETTDHPNLPGDKLPNEVCEAILYGAKNILARYGHERRHVLLIIADCCPEGGHVIDCVRDTPLPHAIEIALDFSRQGMAKIEQS